jgi:hypothetical protein
LDNTRKVLNWKHAEGERMMPVKKGTLERGI